MKDLTKNDMVSPDSLRKNRVRNSARTLLMGLFTTGITTIAPFLIRMLLMRYLGEKYVGLNNVLQSVVWILNITESGIGSVMVFFLYRPAAQGNSRLVNAYLMEIRKLYRIVAGMILLAGIVMLPFLPGLVAGEVPDGENIYILFWGYLLAVAVQYLLWPEMASILAAFQRLDLQYVITILTNAAAYACQVAAICIWHNFMAYVWIVFFQAIGMGILQLLFGRHFFKDCYPCGCLERKQRKEVKKRIFSMFGHQMDEKILGSVDNLFVSSMLGLRMVAVYGNYMYVVTAVSMMINTVYQAVLSGIGNAMVVESRESNEVRFDCMFFLSSLLAGWSTACMLCMYQTFMELWMPGHLLPFGTMALFCFFSYLTQMRRCTQTFKNAGGMWHSDRFKPYVAMLADLVLDFVLIRIAGVQGAVAATILCVGAIEFPWEICVLYKEYFQKNVRGYVRSFLKYTGINVVLCVTVYLFTELTLSDRGICALVSRAAACTGFSILFYFVVYRKNEMMRIWKNTVPEMFHKSYK